MNFSDPAHSLIKHEFEFDYGSALDPPAGAIHLPADVVTEEIADFDNLDQEVIEDVEALQEHHVEKELWIIEKGDRTKETGPEPIVCLGLMGSSQQLF
jgi:hypothetical protein